MSSVPAKCVLQTWTVSVGGTLPNSLFFSCCERDQRMSEPPSLPWSVGGWAFPCLLPTGTKNRALSVLLGPLLGSFREGEESAGQGGKSPTSRADTCPARASSSCKAGKWPGPSCSPGVPITGGESERGQYPACPHATAGPGRQQRLPATLAPHSPL